MLLQFKQTIIDNPILGKLIVTILLLLITLLISRITNKLLFKTIKDNTAYYLSKKRFNYLYAIIFLVVIGIQWSSSKLDLTLYIGFISAGIAISLREIFTNIVAWIIIIVQKPFEVGDRISINGKSGDVVDLKLFHFLIMDVTDKEYGEQSTGRISHLPNNYIFLHQLTNSSKGFAYVWHEIEVKLSKTSNWQLAKELIDEILVKHGLDQIEEAQEEVKKASKRFMLYYNNLTPIQYISYKNGAIVISVRYLSKPRQCRITEDLLWNDILEKFNEASDIELL